MIFVERVIESIGLKVNLPMVLETNNKAFVDLVNNWAAAGRTRHAQCKLNFMRELKAENVLEVVWIPTDENSSDMFTKNLGGKLFEKHVMAYCGEDEYCSAVTDSNEESVGDRGIGAQSLGDVQSDERSG